MGYGVIDVAKAGYQRITQLDVIANNLANASSPGFKAENFYPGAPDNPTAAQGPIPAVSRAMVDFSQGMFKETGSALDLAIEGEGFFTVQTQTGMQYTRKGSFILNKDNQIVTTGGDFVMGARGPVALPGKNFYVDGAGNVMVNGAVADRLDIVRFKNPQALLRSRDGMFMDQGGAGVEKIARPSVKSRVVEMSNVNVFREMVGMIDVQRSFESYQKIIQTIADMDKISVSRIGRLA